MKNKIAAIFSCILLCALSGAAGAYSVLTLEAHKSAQSSLQVRKLELMDGNGHVRAKFAVEDDGSVVLRMLSKDNVPVIELISSDSRVSKPNSPSGSLSIRDAVGTPGIQLGMFREGEGALFFSSQKTRGQVAVGYQPYGDVVDGVDRGIWGIQIKGPNHESTGVGVYTEDSEAKSFTGLHKDGSAK